MTHTDDIERKALQRKLAALVEEYEAVNQQIEQIIDASQLLMLELQAESILTAMKKVNDRLRELGGSHSVTVPTPAQSSALQVD